MKKSLFILILLGLSYIYYYKEKNIGLYEEEDLITEIIKADEEKISQREDLVEEIIREENAEYVRKEEEKRLSEFKNSPNFKKDLDAMAMALYHEARGESKQGIQFVADVIINRMKSRKFWANGVLRKNFPSTIPEVIKNCEFSFYCDGKSDAMPSYYQRKMVYDIAEDRLLARLYYHKPALTNAMFYHVYGINSNYFNNTFPRKFANQFRKKVIGNHVFYEAYSGTKLASL